MCYAYPDIESACAIVHALPKSTSKYATDTRLNTTKRGRYSISTTRNSPQLRFCMLLAIVLEQYPRYSAHYVTFIDPELRRTPVGVWWGHPSCLTPMQLRLHPLTDNFPQREKDGSTRNNWLQRDLTFHAQALCARLLIVELTRFILSENPRHVRICDRDTGKLEPLRPPVHILLQSAWCCTLKTTPRQIRTFVNVLSRCDS